MTENLQQPPKPQLLTLYQVVLKILERFEMNYSDIEWFGTYDGGYRITPQQFEYFARYSIRGASDVPQDLCIIKKNASIVRDFLGVSNCIVFSPNDNDPLSEKNWTLTNRGESKDSKYLTPYALFDLTNMRANPIIDTSNNEPSRLKIHMLGLDLIRLWNELIDHGWMFHIVTENLLHPPKEGPIHTSTFEGVQVGDILLRIYVAGFDEYHSSPERMQVLQYLNTHLATHSSFLRLHEVPKTSSIFVFFRPLGTTSVG